MRHHFDSSFESGPVQVQWPWAHLQLQAEDVRYKTVKTIIVHILLAAAAVVVSAVEVGECRGVLCGLQALEN